MLMLVPCMSGYPLLAKLTLVDLSLLLLSCSIQSNILAYADTSTLQVQVGPRIVFGRMWKKMIK